MINFTGNWPADGSIVIHEYDLPEDTMAEETFTVKVTLPESIKAALDDRTKNRAAYIRGLVLADLGINPDDDPVQHGGDRGHPKSRKNLKQYQDRGLQE